MTFDYTVIEDAWTAKNREIADLRDKNERLLGGLLLSKMENERLRVALTDIWNRRVSDWEELDILRDIARQALA